ncbi:hypothetical protein ACUUL3_16400 [Thiovibrio sp. JS02]
MLTKMTTIFFVFLVIPLHTSMCYAFDDKETHPKINISSSNLSSINSYLTEILKFHDGLKSTLVNDSDIEFFLGLGGTKEDSGLRSLNHFHDPLMPWEEANLTTTEIVGNSSALIWAQSSENDASWHVARNSFYEALLTNSPASYVTTFTTLGQLIHLVSDMAVPAHVRNDAHPEVIIPWVSHFELTTKKWAQQSALNLDGLPFTPDPEIFNHAIPNNDAPLPIASLFDIDAYSGTNPEITMDPLIGLAEYTNANFLSEDTIFSNYQHPDEADTNHITIAWNNPVPVDAEDGQIDNKIYVYKIIADGQTSLYRLAAAGYHALDEYESNIPIHNLILDEEVYRDYAGQLVPRAVGYSTALLNYFFRGKLAVKTPRLTTAHDGSISWIELLVKNDSLLGGVPERFGGGTIEFVYSYTPAGTSEPVYIRQQTPVYTVSDATDPINSNYVTISVQLDTPIPANAAEIAATLVYFGKLGQEEGAVAAKVQKLAPNSRIAYMYQPGGEGNESNIYVVSPDGSGLLQVTSASAPNTSFFAPAWSSDGGLLAFEKEVCTNPIPDQPCSIEYYQRSIQVIATFSGDIYPNNVQYSLFEGNDHPLATPAFSPDGTKIAALMLPVSESDYWSTLVVFDLANNTWEVVNRNDDRSVLNLWGSAPAWSPTGDAIAYYLWGEYSDVTKQWEYEGDIFVITPDGATKTRLTDDDYTNTHPSWSPDGETIVFASNRDGGTSLDIWTMDKTGLNMRKVFDCDPVDCRTPKYSPDGRQLTFFYGDALYTLTLADGSLHQVVAPGFLAYEAAWSPYLPLPKLNDVGASPSTVTAGVGSTIRWTTEGAQVVRVDDGKTVQEYPAKTTTQVIVSPDLTTTYTITAVGVSGATTETVTVTVAVP